MPLRATGTHARALNAPNEVPAAPTTTNRRRLRLVATQPPKNPPRRVAAAVGSGPATAAAAHAPEQTRKGDVPEGKAVLCAHRVDRFLVGGADVEEVVVVTAVAHVRPGAKARHRQRSIAEDQGPLCLSMLRQGGLHSKYQHSLALPLAQVAGKQRYLANRESSLSCFTRREANRACTAFWRAALTWTK